MTAEPVKLGDVADMLSGFAFKSAESLDHSEEGVFLVRGDNVQQDSSAGEKKPKNGEAMHTTIFHAITCKKMTSFLRWIGPLWEAASSWHGLRIRTYRACWCSVSLAFEASMTKHGQTFLRYVLSTPDFLAHIDRITTGANILTSAAKTLRALPFNCQTLTFKIESLISLPPTMT